MTQAARQRRILAALMFATWALLMATAAFAQDVPPELPAPPSFLGADQAELVTYVQSDSLGYAEWIDERRGGIVRAVYLQGYSEPIYWIGPEWFGMPGVWEELPIPLSPERLQDRSLWAAYWQTVYIINEVQEEVTR